ncbi:MAG: HAMP domain-containing histidine kinase [Turicibacter sp.]|nr:HAMP domain-containing histidine kinase [Turicibacter sp.]
MIDVEISKQEWLNTVTGYYEALYHDLKAPMTMLFNHIQLMEKTEKLSPETSERLSEIKRASFRMAKLVRDANDRMRLSNGMLQPNYMMADAVTTIEDICKEACALMQTKDIDIVFKSSEESIFMAMDKQFWERIVLNILANSRDYSPPGSKIAVNLKMQRNNIILSIRDYGIGIPKDKILDIFSRYEGDTARGLNTGLGLYIVKELLLLMNGSIRFVQAKPGAKVVIKAPIFQIKAEKDSMTVDDFFATNAAQMELSNFRA